LQIEHAQHLAPGSDARFGQQGIVASVQVSYFNYLLGFLLFTSCYFMVLVIVYLFGFFWICGIHSSVFCKSAAECWVLSAVIGKDNSSFATLTKFGF